jgi:hypothetical protein
MVKVGVKKSKRQIFGDGGSTSISVMYDEVIRTENCI